MNKEKILIAYDGSACADAALEDLKKAGFPADTEALAVSVADVFLPPSGFSEESIPESVVVAARLGRTHASQAIKNAQELAERAAKKLRTDFRGWQVKAEAFADSPAWGIIKKAQDWKADLIVVGAHGFSATTRLFLGSISQIIATHAPCSVRIVHTKPEEVNSPPRIVVGIDGSSDSYEALREVASRTWKKGVAIHLITAVDPRMMSAVFASGSSTIRQWIGDTENRGQHWIKRLIEDAEGKLRSKGFTVTSFHKEGDPKKILLEEAQRWGADCIVVGARGLTGIKHFLMGSVSSSIAARAHCTVEIIRAHQTLDEKKQ